MCTLVRGCVGAGAGMTEVNGQTIVASGRCNRYWRIFATGLSFFAFGLGGLLFGLLLSPVFNLALRQQQRRQRVARRVVQCSFAFHIELMRALGVLSYEIRGRERLNRDGLLILANHPTLIDVVFLISLLPNADCIVKSALARNPFTRAPVRAAGYVHNDEGSGLVDDCVAAVRSGSNLLVFPEGTRSRRGESMRLQRGAANIAVRGRLNVTPVKISCHPMTLGKGDKWYSVPQVRFHFVVDVQPDIEVTPFLTGGHGEALAARQFTDYLTRYFAAKDDACRL